ncbi:MAG: AIPR family protein [Anaerolineales bacterium]|nr:AIPR family protein [Anaerolineales bacterium]
MTPKFPSYLNSYSDLRDHFEENFSGLSPREKGIKFAKVVQELIPYTNFGSRGFEQAELQKESHDEGVDLIAEHAVSNQILCIQSKYTLSDKNGFDSIISNFQGFHKKHFTDSAGPLFAHGGVSVGDEPTVYYQIVAGNNLENIIKKYEGSSFSSIQFYHQLRDTKQLEIIDGHKILELLKTAYRKANILPSDFELTFETDFIEKDNVYIGVLSGKELRRLYGIYGDSLFYENIRNFLTSRTRPDSGTAINEEIIKTVRKEPDQFLSRNNGIVFKAKEVSAVNNKTIRLQESSVVNGCQTTMCIVSYTEDENEVYVTAKVVGTNQAWDVARAANLQNDVSRFELEIAQFLRPQVVNKAASHEGYRVLGNESAFTLLDNIYQYELMYEDLRGLFVGIFSNSPNNIFDTNYLDLLPEVISKFYEEDPEGNTLLTKLFQIQQIANKSMQILQSKMSEKNLTISAFQRFFKDNKAAYRAFFTLLASCSLSGVDLSQKESDTEKRYKQVNEFLEKTLQIIQNEPEKFQRYYRFAMSAVTTIIPPDKDTDSVKQLIWQVIRKANFGLLLDRMQFEALNHEV